MASKNPPPQMRIFKCDQHAAIISEKLQSFYEQNEFFDSVLIAGSNSVSIQAHRVVLCAFSEYFLDIFRGDPGSALQGNAVELKEIDASALKLIIDFMYLGSIELRIEMVEGILRTALFLKMKALVDGCCGLIEKYIDSSNSLSWLRLARDLSLSELMAKSLECTYTHFEEISKKEEFLMLSENEIRDLLFNDNPYGDFEEVVFGAMVAWINYDKSNREHLVFQLLSMVRFQALTPKFIIENRKAVCRTVESYELICNWLQWHLSPETRSNDQKNCSLRPRKNKKKLAVIRSFFDGKINIETFNPIANSWSIEIETHFPSTYKPFSIIVIDNKLIVSATRNCLISGSLKYLDMQTSQWIDLPPMKNARIFFRMADLKGNLCVVGPQIMTGTLSVDIYNFSTRKWQDYDIPPQPKGNIRTQIATHVDMVYVLDPENRILHSYNSCSRKCTSKKIEIVDYQNYCLAAVAGFLYIIGGDSVQTVKRYNLSNDSWCEMTSLPYALQNKIKTFVGNNTFMVNDSGNIYEYHLDSDTWDALIPQPLRMDNNLNEILNVCYLTAHK